MSVRYNLRPSLPAVHPRAVLKGREGASNGRTRITCRPSPVTSPTTTDVLPGLLQVGNDYDSTVSRSSFSEDVIEHPSYLSHPCYGVGEHWGLPVVATRLP